MLERGIPSGINMDICDSMPGLHGDNVANAARQCGKYVLQKARQLMQVNIEWRATDVTLTIVPASPCFL